MDDDKFVIKVINRADEQKKALRTNPQGEYTALKIQPNYLPHLYLVLNFIGDALSLSQCNVHCRRAESFLAQICSTLVLTR